MGETPPDAKRCYDLLANTLALRDSRLKCRGCGSRGNEGRSSNTKCIEGRVTVVVAGSGLILEAYFAGSSALGAELRGT